MNIQMSKETINQSIKGDSKMQGNWGTSFRTSFEKSGKEEKGLHNHSVLMWSLIYLMEKR
jgi:hypothetical protein